MIICPNCGRENADHYKFCLGCGTELKGDGAVKAAAPAAAPQLGLPGRKLRLDSPLFGAKRPGGLGGLGGLSRRLGAKAGEDDDQPTDEAGAEEERDTAAGHVVAAPPAVSRLGGRLAPPPAESSVESDPSDASDEEPEIAEPDDSGDDFEGPALDDPAPPRAAEASRPSDHFDDDEDDFEGEIEDADAPAKPAPARAAPLKLAPVQAAPVQPVSARPAPAVQPASAQPVAPAQPVASAQPAASAQPVVSAQPVASAQPAAAAQPARPAPVGAPPPVAQPAPVKAAPPAAEPARPAAVGRPAPVAAAGAPARPIGPPPVAARVAPPPAAARARPVADPSPPVFDDDAPDDSIMEDDAPPPPGGRVCHACGAVVPQGFKFCGVCGTRYDAPQPESPSGSLGGSMQAVGAPTAHLVLIHPDGTEGEIFPLSGETTVGRAHPSPIFAEDPFLSPRHATFYFVQGQLYVRDEGSLNGVFLRIRAEVELFHYDMFRIGQQLLRFEEMSQVRPIMPGSGDGTTLMGSPARGTWGRLASVVALDTTTTVWPLRKPEVFLGRERGDLVFPEDGFVSGSHCKLSMRRGRYFLGDLDSTNGTYLRIKGEGIVTRGDLLLLGQQLFKVELNR